MKFISPHIAPILHNAAGSLIAAVALAICGSATWIIKEARDITIPLWVALFLISVWTAAMVVLSAKKSQKHLASVATLLDEHKKAKARIEQRHADAVARLEGGASKMEGQYQALAAELISLVERLLAGKAPGPPEGPESISEKLDRLIRL